MSYNIDFVKTPVLDAWMYAKDVKRLYKKLSDWLPEYCFLSDMIVEAQECENGDEKVFLPNFDWAGTLSGRTYEDLEEEIVPYIKGTVEAVFTWEKGDDITELNIYNCEAIELEDADV